MRLIVGPLKLGLCSGFFHRINSLRTAASAYDYSPYSMPKPDPPLSELSPPSAEDFDALIEDIPNSTIQLTIFAPTIEFQLMDHPYFAPAKGKLYRKLKVNTDKLINMYYLVSTNTHHYTEELGFTRDLKYF